MRMDRRGVTALPIKLLIITIILSLSLPMISEALESNEDDVNTELMESESRRIANAATSVYYSMNGATRMVEIDVPEGCSMVLGGEGNGAYAIHMYCGGELTSEHWMEKPILSFKDTIELYGDCTLSITTDGNLIEVDRI